MIAGQSVRLAREALTYVPTIVLGPVVGLLSTLIYTRLLSPYLYGAYVLAMGSLNIAAMVTGGWLGIAPVQFFPEASQKNTQMVFLSSTLRLCGVAVLCGAMLYLALLGLAGKRSFALAGLLLLPAMHVSKGLMAILRARLQTSLYVWIGSIGTILSLGAGAAFYLITRKPEAILLGTALVAWLQIALVAAVQRDIVCWRVLSARPSAAVVREMLHFSLAMALIGISSQVLQLGDRFFLAHFHGDAAAGIYAANYAVAEKAIGLVFAPLMMAVYPLAVTRWAAGKDKEAVAALLRESGRLYLIGGSIGLTLLWKFDEPLSRWLLSAKFSKEHEIIPWVALGVFLWGFAQLYHLGLYLEKRTITVALMFAIPLAVNLGLNMALIPRYGGRGAAWATAGSYFLYTLIARGVTRHLVALFWDPPWATLVRCVAAAAISVTFVTEWFALLRIHFLVCALAACLGYLFVLFLGGEPLDDIFKMLVLRGSNGKLLGSAGD